MRGSLYSLKTSNIYTFISFRDNFVVRTFEKGELNNTNYEEYSPWFPWSSFQTKDVFTNEKKNYPVKSRAIFNSCISLSAGSPTNCSETSDKYLVSCGPYNATRDQCLGRGCCWNLTRCYGIVNQTINQTNSNATKPTGVAITTNEARTTTSSLTSTTPQ